MIMEGKTHFEGGRAMIRISACVIVKDEEENIQQWLDGVKSIVDEMIVVDTGSTDRTMEIAKAGGAATYFFAWRNDFAAAKNYAIEKAKGDWIIFLDADEYFSVQARGKLRCFLEKIHGSRKFVCISSPLYNIDKDNGNRLMSTMIQVRVFRNMRSMRYRGKVHETLYCRVKKGGLCIPTDFSIYHTGYSSSLTKKKNQRNLELLLEDIEASGGEQPRHYNYLSVTYYNLRQYEKAAYYAKLAIQVKAKGMESTHIQQYLVWLRAEQGLGASGEVLQQIVRQALSDIPDHPDLLWEDALFDFHHQDYVQAEKKIARLLERVEDKEFMRSYESTIQAKIPFLAHIIGLIREMQGRLEEALQFYRQALQGYSYRADMVESLLNLMAGRDPQKTIEYLDTIYDREKDRAFLAGCLMNRPRDEVYLYYVRPEENSYECLMGKKDFLGAVRVAASALMHSFDEAATFWQRGENHRTWDVLLPQKWKNASTESSAIDVSEENALIAKVVRFMRELALALLFLPIEELRECAEEIVLLPKGMQACIICIHSRSALEPEELDAYKTLWKEVLRYGSATLIRDFGLLAEVFDDRTILSVAKDLCGKRQWQAALTLYQKITADSKDADAGFWYQVGRCFFHCGERETAFECFTRAREMNPEMPEPRWYLVWCKERTGEGGSAC